MAYHDRVATRGQSGWRLRALRFFFMLVGCLIAARLFVLQVVEAGFYKTWSQNQHTLSEVLVPVRGSVYVKDHGDATEYAIATNEPRAEVIADPRRIDQPITVALAIAKILQLEGWDTYGQPEVDAAGVAIDVETETERLVERLSKTEDPWEPVASDVSRDDLDAILALEVPGIDYHLTNDRTYPEKNFGGHILGFFGRNEAGEEHGYYGVEGYFEEFLAGIPGSLYAEGDAAGRWIGVGARTLTPAVDGGDVLLTIDRTVQYMACKKLREGVTRFEADGGALVILEPATGRVLAMCGAPDFDPADYGNVEDGSIYNNPAIFEAYEAGSVMKAFTVATALDRELITATTLFDDQGTVQVDDYTIKNSDFSTHGAHGTVTMTTALDESLNTAMVWLMRKMGRDVQQDYLENFGFGQLTGIELATEASGTLAALDEAAEVYAATASFGQGITVTPLQMAAAYAALANGGNLMQPYVVEELRHPDGTVEKRVPKKIRQVISAKTSATISGMLVSVVENGHGKRAGVDGYYIAGKTGTAQVAGRGGYVQGLSNGSFAGFGPVGDPKFAMVVRFENPRTVDWAESSAAPIFGEIADFLLQYYDVPPER